MTAHSQRRHLKVEDIDGITVVNFLDKKLLDKQNIQIMGEELFCLVNELGCRKVIVSFANVEYLSSDAIGKFIFLHKLLMNAGGRLVLCGIDPQIYEVFTMTKMN